MIVSAVIFVYIGPLIPTYICKPVLNTFSLFYLSMPISFYYNYSAKTYICMDHPFFQLVYMLFAMCTSLKSDYSRDHWAAVVKCFVCSPLIIIHTVGKCTKAQQITFSLSLLALSFMFISSYTIAHLLILSNTV